MSFSDRVSIRPHIDQKSVYISPKTKSQPEAAEAYHVYFVPGNPGCIAYYHVFLSQLADSFYFRASVDNLPKVHVFGHSLANFAHGPNLPHMAHRPVLGLQEQISYAEKNLDSYVTAQRRQGVELSMQTPRLANIVLVGHSVGAYICMELLRRWRDSERATGYSSILGFRIVGFVGLFPTITWLGKSPRGKILGVSLLKHGSTNTEL